MPTVSKVNGKKKPMHMRVHEILGERGMTAYQVARDSDGRLTEATMYRIVRVKGLVGFVSLGVLQALCDVLEVEPRELFVYERQLIKATTRKSRRRTA